MGLRVYRRFVRNGIDEDTAADWAQEIIDPFGKRKRSRKDDPLRHLELEQLAHFSPQEQEAIKDLTDTLIEEERGPEEEELDLLRHEHRAVDIAMFGRMMADATAHNVEGAVQVAHAITVHEAVVEDDYFAAVDDLNDGFFAAVDELNGEDSDAGPAVEREDEGAAHLGEKEFGAGLFYQYICIDRELLVENLSGDEELAETSMAALVEAAATVAPSGMQNSYGSRARASYILAEKGSQQPRSLSVAYLTPVSESGYLESAIDRLEEARDQMDRTYGDCAEEKYVMSVLDKETTLNGLLDFVAPNVEVASQ
jgi:CRISPR system Cascade subunit CasC